MGYSLGKSPISNNFQVLEKPRLVIVGHPVYMWNDTFSDNGVTLVDISEPGNILLIMFVNIQKEDHTCDCYVFNQKGKFGWALIDINSITYLDGEHNDFSS